ncbi:unnamed protein product [Rotaria socialis]|uniref:Anion exchange protein n=1 Tax=Rotaria socialis TaxID=392032 RepID=A0A820PCT6_9BILA|nr:unnamed protein product [Rotaria socialis]CAF4406543.1 unnamed protein product [Rotaria socialis]
MQSSTANINRGRKSGEISVFIFGQNDDDNDDDDDYDSKSVKEFPKYNYDLTENTFNIDCDNVDDNQIILSALTTIEEDTSESDNNLVGHQNITNSRHQQMDKNLFSPSTKKNERPFHFQHKTHVESAKEQILDDASQPASSISTNRQENSYDNYKTVGHRNTTSVPLIVVTHDETDRTTSKRLVQHSAAKIDKAKKKQPAISSINMDNISLKNYFSSSSGLEPPTPPEKNPSTRNIQISLSSPGIPATPTSLLHAGGKRRGVIHRSSYKRAHKGRSSIDHTPNDLFIELQELRLDEDNDCYWHECARWIRYEEYFDVEMQRWQAPRISCLNFHSLLELRRGLQYGIVLLDLEEQTLEGIYDGVINDAIAMGQMNKDLKDELLRILTSDHRHPDPRSSFRRRSSIFDFPQTGIRRSSLAFKKSDQINFDDTRRSSLLELKMNGEFNRNMKNIVVKYDNIDETVATDVCAKRSEAEQNNNVNGSKESVNQIRSSLGTHRLSQTQTKKSRDSIPYKSDVMRRISNNAECAEVLIGTMRSLPRLIMAFVRLSQGQLIDNMSEVQLPVKFIFLLIGPGVEEYFEIGRALSTLFSTQDFRNVAYQAMDRRDLLNGINDFLSDSIVLPPADYDKELLLPIIETAKIKKTNSDKRITAFKKQNSDPSNENQQQHVQSTRVLLAKISSLSNDKQDEDPFLRRGFVFGGVYHEMRRRYAHFKSDFLDACSLRCSISLIFMSIACLAPALTFGGIIADKTCNRLGVNEMLIASSINGFLFGLFSGQPLLILGPTGPFLVFEEVVYDLCQSLDADFWTVRCCVSLWTTFFIIMLVAFEGSFMIRHVTRFTEEIFALIIALVYLYEPFKKLYKIFLSNPVRSKYSYDFPFTCSCNISSILNKTFAFDDMNSSFDSTLSSSTSKYSCYDCKSKQDSFSSSTLSYRNSTLASNDEDQLPNKALLSFIILIGTCFIAVALKLFRRSKFFGRTTRQTLSDFGMTIALICMVLFDMLVTKTAGGHDLTQKINVPDSIRPSDVERDNTWFISPLRKPLPLWAYFASSFPAILISVVLFFEVELTSIMIQSKLKCVHPTKMIKGTGYHLDILIAGILISISGLFGLPWICAAPVRSLAHVASLSKYSNTHAPGEKARLIDINDQRLTNIGVHLFIGCTIFAAPIIRKIPVAALFGIFLYFGIVSISGTQLFSRIKMTFIPTKYHPNFGYLRRVRQMKRNFYTFIQVTAAGLLITIKLTSFAFLFPLILVLLVPFRKMCLPFIFTEREFAELDGDETPDGTFDDEIDFYGQVHLPI